MSSRVSEGFDSVFFWTDREVVETLEREVSGLVKHGCAGADVAAVAVGPAGTLGAVPGVVSGGVYEFDRAGLLTSGRSEEGGSEPILGRSGVRKGDLNGFLSVFVASFSLRRLACGVDILVCLAALKECGVQKLGDEVWWGEVVCLLVTPG
jgi:hypothetical protein